jgi:hypothetical protein
MSDTETVPNALTWQRIELHAYQTDEVLGHVPSNGRWLLTERAKVPGGWLVRTHISRVLASAHPVDQPWVGGIGVGAGISITYVPDPEHTWDVAEV